MNNEAQNQPFFTLQKIYTKDISFENPNAPDIFVTEHPDQGIEFNLAVQNRQVGEEHWEVALKISALARNDESKKVIYQVEVEQAAVFLIRNVPEEHIALLLNVDCPTIIFPYTRQLISQLTTDGGFTPLLLEPFNFAAAYHSNLEQQGQQKPN